MEADAIIFGGGVAGLWALDELHRSGHCVVLVETCALGAGQTIASQGIIHGGIKYTLAGVFTDSARAVREMPGIWRSCLSGRPDRIGPDLSGVRVLAEECHLWRTDSLSSRVGLLGAAAGLRSDVRRLAREERPAALRQCPGDVFAVREQVIDVANLLSVLRERHEPRLLKVDPGGIEFVPGADGFVQGVRLSNPQTGERLEVQPGRVILAAGAGNAELRKAAGLAAGGMQLRPLHQVMIRGDLPTLFGHCVDGAKTRATITTATDTQGRVVWYVGGQVAEDGTRMSEAALLDHARRELKSVLPGVSFDGAEWATVRVDRAEPATPGGARPSGPHAALEGNVITTWPTKLAMAPELARMIRKLMPPEPRSGAVVSNWPRPLVASTPWDESSAKFRLNVEHELISLAESSIRPKDASDKPQPKLSLIGFGAFKIGRNQGIKYLSGYDLPTDAEAESLLNGVLDLGISYIDTAPAYGVSEERIGKFLARRASEFVLSTKVGETFEGGRSLHDFSAEGVRASIDRSRQRLRRDVLDLVFIHAGRNDLEVLEHTDAAQTLSDLRSAGVIRKIGFSGYTTPALMKALGWADALMLEYHLSDRSLELVIAEARRRGVDVIVKKGLASGTLDPDAALRFVLSNPGVSSLLVGSINLEHMRRNCAVARDARRAEAG